jgi:hypothetical protein
MATSPDQDETGLALLVEDLDAVAWDLPFSAWMRRPQRTWSDQRNL